jgi:hypothetical protein
VAKPLELEPYFARVRATLEYFGTHVMWGATG